MLENYYKQQHANYKKDNAKLTFKEWYILTGVIEKEIEINEANINDLKEDLKCCYDFQKESIKNDIKDYRKQNNRLKKILEKLHD